VCRLAVPHTNASIVDSTLAAGFAYPAGDGEVAVDRLLVGLAKPGGRSRSRRRAVRLAGRDEVGTMPRSYAASGPETSVAVSGNPVSAAT
jgi:hypothetical protein